MTDMNHQIKLRAALDYLKKRNIYALDANNQFVYRNHAETNVSVRALTVVRRTAPQATARRS